MSLSRAIFSFVFFNSCHRQKPLFCPLSESGFWAFAVWSLGEGFVAQKQELSDILKGQYKIIWTDFLFEYSNSRFTHFRFVLSCIAVKRLFEYLSEGKNGKIHLVCP